MAGIDVLGVGQGPSFVSGDYLSAISTQSKTLTLAYNPTRVENFTSLAASGITIAGGGLDEIYFSKTGLYNVQFSLQVTNNDNQEHLFYVWGAINGVSIPLSASILSIQSTHGGDKGHVIAALNFFISVTAGQYFNLVWSGDNTNIAIETIPSPANPIPVSPACILTISEV